jgi:hypothetical protein
LIIRQSPQYLTASILLSNYLVNLRTMEEPLSLMTLPIKGQGNLVTIFNSYQLLALSF